MNTFKGIQKTFNFTQQNTAGIKDVFPLLCPVREKDWLDGWKYRMIYSKSGYIEQDCVFATPYDYSKESIWQVTQYNPSEYFITFIRFTPAETIVKINIQLEKSDTYNTKTHIRYQYTGLNIRQNSYIRESLENDFLESMRWWEKAINYYLKTGCMLKK